MMLDIKWLKIKIVKLSYMELLKISCTHGRSLKGRFTRIHFNRSRKVVQELANLLGVVFEGQIHSSKLKDMLLSTF